MIGNKVVKNASWIIGCKIVQSVLGLVVSMLTARFLGPSNFGIINYAASLVAFAVPIMQLGITSILVQELVAHPEEEGKTLGTSLALTFASSLLSMLGVIAFAFVANAGEPTTILVCTLYSIMLVAQALEMSQYWFQAKYLSKYTSLIMLAAYFITSAYKIYLLATRKSVYWFALSYALDYALIAIGLLIAYKKLGTQKLSFSMKKAKSMLGRSRYYILSDLLVVVFAQISKIILKFMADDAAVGYYSAAIACVGMSAFVFTAVIDSMRPLILESKGQNNEAFEKNLKMLYSIIIFLTFAQNIVFSVFAEPIVMILYGAEYLDAVLPLQIVAWYTTFSYIGSVRNIWILAEEKQKYLWLVNLLGAVFNIIANIVCISLWGIVGAAIVALATQIFTNVITGYIIRPLSYSNDLFVQSLNPKILVEGIKKLLRKRS